MHMRDSPQERARHHGKVAYRGPQPEDRGVTITLEKTAQFLANRIGQDALTIADLLQQLHAREARIAELEDALNKKEEPHAHRSFG
jgi:hypothetical protein